MITLPIVLIVVAGVALWALRRGNMSPASRRSLVVLAVVTCAFTVLVVAPLPFVGPELLVVQLLLIAMILTLVAVWLASLRPRGRARTWAEAHGVMVTDANRRFVEAYVTEGHRLRLICGFGGAVALAALSRGVGVTVPVSGWVWLMGGYLVGVVWSEAWLTRLPEGTRRAASLTPRRIRDYLLGRLLVAQIVVPVVALGLATWAAVGSPSPPAEGWYSDLDRLAPSTLRVMVIAIGGSVVTLAVVIWALQRHIVTKPQPAGDAALTAVDDAVRSSSVHLLSGTSIAIGLVCIGSQLQVLAARGQMTPSFADFISLILFFGALIAWRYYGHRPWVVRRDRSTPLARPEPGKVRS